MSIPHTHSQGGWDVGAPLVKITPCTLDQWGRDHCAYQHIPITHLNNKVDILFQKHTFMLVVDYPKQALKMYN